MFNNIIYFLVVILIFHLNYPEIPPPDSLLSCILWLFGTWLIFAVYCWWGFRTLRKRLSDLSEEKQALLTGRYQSLVAILSVLSIFLFAQDIYLLNLKSWILMIPGFDRFMVLQGLLALSLFFFYLCTIWYFAYPVYLVVFRPGITRGSFIQSNVKFNFPLLFPWVFLNLVHDLLYISPWGGPGSFLGGMGGEILIFVGCLPPLVVFMPGIIRYWWSCKPLEASEKARILESFLREKDFKYRGLLNWPIFEGRMLTAGIMGVVPRFRYILVTDSLLQVLSVEELKAVLAHEMGHAKYRHLLLYLVFFAAFFLVFFGLFDLFYNLLFLHPFFSKVVSSQDPKTMNLFYLVLAAPMVLTLFLYIRYVMGFYMRNFERQADLYSQSTMGTPEPIVSSLEKIALLSGKSRNLPSWHHFSIRERVEYLWRTLRDPGMMKRHNRFLASTLFLYLVGVILAGYLVYFSPVRENLASYVIHQRIAQEPDNIDLYIVLAMAYQQRGKNEEAMRTYEKIVQMDPHNALALNNLAWFLVTAPDADKKDKERGLDLAKRAVAEERSPVYLDTLAEACYVNGYIQEAIRTMEEAISLAKENQDYYKKQLQKFLAEGNRAADGRESLPHAITAAVVEPHGRPDSETGCAASV